MWSTANHYTWLYSGGVLTVLSLRSAGTAMDVLGNYRLRPDLAMTVSLLGLGVNLCAAFVLGRLLPGRLPRRRTALAACALAALAGGLAGGLAWQQRRDPPTVWTAKYDLIDFGYPVYFVEQAVRTRVTVTEPAGYDQQRLEALAEERTGTAGTAERAADIILILNETYYFLDDYTPVEADASYTENWDGLTNAIRGRVTVPNVGGGTNGTEYELLTGNSLYLLSAWAPFSTLDLAGANSVVRYLTDLGYSAAAMHDASPNNYNRGLGYPALGFTQTMFRGSFTPDRYGDRLETDAALYRDIFAWYEQAGDQPRFLYALTYQNHGGYEQNDGALDTVHAGRDFGDLTDDVNEFLTSIRMSDEALAELTAYFNGVDRPVLVCMLGDHAPSFIDRLPGPEGDMSAEDKEVVSRATPFFIWANDAFGPIGAGDAGTVSLTDLMPKVLELAGLPLSAYYRTILELSEQIPVRLSTGLYRTAAGEYGQYGPEDGAFETLAPYYFMEYNNLQRAAERRQELFEPPAGE